MGAIERATMAVITDLTFHSGEVCDAQKEAVRDGCKDILTEGAEYHMSALNLDYYVAFHENWKRQHCFDEITKKLGYRFVLNSARLTKLSDNDYSLGIVIENQGWARLYKNRPLQITATTADKALEIVSAPNSLTTIDAGKAAPFYFSFSTPKDSKNIEFCIRAPDLEPTLTDDLRYAIRFANEAQSGQFYGDKSGKFCFEMPLHN